MKILSLDQSSRFTGYAVYEDTNLIKWGLIDTHHYSSSENRYNAMCAAIDKLLIDYKPDVVVFEDVYEFDASLIFAILSASGVLYVA